MACNIGKTERIIRGVVGAGVLAYGVMNGSMLADIIGGVLLVTAIIGWCPPYAIFGINTGCERK